MRLVFHMNQADRSVRGAIRFVALLAAAFVAVAAAHETLLAIPLTLAHSHCDSEHTPGSSAPTHHREIACPLCVLAGAPTLPALAAELPLPLDGVENVGIASRLTPGVRDTSCFPHLRRAPPSRVLPA